MIPPPALGCRRQPHRPVVRPIQPIQLHSDEGRCWPSANKAGGGMKFISLTLFWCAWCVPLAWAEPVTEEFSALRQQVQQLTELVQQLNATVQGQQQRITELERPAPLGTPAAAALPRQASGGANLAAFNPEIGVLADVVGQLSESSADGEGNDKLNARELELVFGHPIDPYSRLDATIAFSDFEEPALEEAYITHWGLPGEIKARIGLLRPKIGKASPLHRDSLETVDEPLVVSNYLGAEGLSRTAVELSGFLPVPWTALTHELTDRKST